MLNRTERDGADLFAFQLMRADGIAKQLSRRRPLALLDLMSTFSSFQCRPHQSCSSAAAVRYLVQRGTCLLSSVG